ncbi:hypothetical protein Pmani_027957 [Petrolisthes manimaculis]|uniref:USP domain-containing protein n=1 Tax=Petrolisthes manimaculis TaxID=1843537 RepID=A0AAE1TYJ3_9EUCA|nr:hypothetical protein Pmani_027957 [Petrolisthes manimaculis]
MRFLNWACVSSVTVTGVDRLLTTEVEWFKTVRSSMLNWACVSSVTVTGVDRLLTTEVEWLKTVRSSVTVTGVDRLLTTEVEWLKTVRSSVAQLAQWMRLFWRAICVLPGSWLPSSHLRKNMKLVVILQSQFFSLGPYQCAPSHSMYRLCTQSQTITSMYYSVEGAATDPEEDFSGEERREQETNLDGNEEDAMNSSSNEESRKEYHIGILKYSREETFTVISIDIRNYSNLYDSLEQYVKGNLLEGDNAYLCEKCDKKVDTVKRICLKKLPPIMAIQLKRFDYDWERECSIKFNDYFEFPRELDMDPYTVAGLARNGELIDYDPEDMKTVVCSKYKLTGIVVHSGQASGGHYYSYILHRNGINLMMEK